MSTSAPESLYDYPVYYDVVFGSDWRAEFKFLEGVFRLHGRRPTRSLFEPACGTGRLLVPLAKAGYRVAGNDLNERAVDYCNARLKRRGQKPTAVVGDMADFRLAKPVDAAFNTINSFRHLSTEAQAESHLHCMAAALKPGGIYVLGLHLTPTRGEPINEESWSARRGHLAVNSRMWTVERDTRRRAERVIMQFDIYTPRRQFRLSEDLTFRIYTAAQIRRLLERSAVFDVAETYDFAYDLSTPIEVGPETEDVVFVLRKRG